MSWAYNDISTLLHVVHNWVYSVGFKDLWKFFFDPDGFVLQCGFLYNLDGLEFLKDAYTQSLLYFIIL